METIEVIPTWRHSTTPITLVAEPTLAWMHEHAEWGLRFSLQSDGRIWWGDAFTVLHADICRFHAQHAPDINPSFIDKTTAICVGVLMRGKKSPERWRLVYVQWFMTAERNDPQFAKPFLTRITTWNDVVGQLGDVVYETVNEEF